MSRMRLLLGLFVLVSLVASETRPDISLDDVVAMVGQKFEYLVGDEKFLAEYEIYKVKDTLYTLFIGTDWPEHTV